MDHCLIMVKGLASLEEAMSFIENLKLSYILKGVNGYVFSFMPIIHKRIH